MDELLEKADTAAKLLDEIGDGVNALSVDENGDGLCDREKCEGCPLAYWNGYCTLVEATAGLRTLSWFVDKFVKED